MQTHTPQSEIAQLPYFNAEPRERRSTMIANKLREMILSGRLKPGDRLPTEAQLCKHFAVSRTTLRESIQMLRVSGLLDVTPGRGSFIRLPDISAIFQDISIYSNYNAIKENDSCFVRNLLLVELCRRACTATPAQKRTLMQNTLHLEHSPEQNAAAERNWCLTITKIHNNHMATTLMEGFFTMIESQLVQRYQNPARKERAIAMQQRINMAITEGDQAMTTRLVMNFCAI